MQGDYTRSHDASTYQYADSSKSSLLKYNHALQHHLRALKNKIEDAYANRKWDRYKKFANEYELVFTTCYGCPSLSKYIPISRSFFKMWEVISDLPEVYKLDRREGLTMTFMAEGPGGFMEAMLKKRNQLVDKSVSVNDRSYGITLTSHQKNIPYWKLKSDVFQNNAITLLTGEDGTGDLTHLPNIDAFVSSVGRHQCDVITADGGFDFSADFNNQEVMSLKLIVCEVTLALQIQKVSDDSTFFLKIYDIFTMPTMQILYVLKMFYTHVTFIKPLTSRPANSEKYVLCHGFKRPELERDILNTLRQCIASSYFEDVLPSHITLPTAFFSDIIHYNQHYAYRQALNVYYTLTYIILVKQDKDKDKNDSPSSLLVKGLRRQLVKAIKWCTKYGLEISLDTLKQYHTRYLT